MTVLYLAPIKGITDAVYRRSFAKFFKGFDSAVTPFIATQKIKELKPNVLREIAPENNIGMTVIPQLLSKEPERFIYYEHILSDLGYKTINWNLGCPSPMVINRMRGSGLLPFPDYIDSFLDKIFSEVSCNISIKMRLGRKKEDEIFKVLPILNRYPISEIIIHPRTAIQMYKGDVSLDVFEKALSLTSHQIIYSGDIYTLEDFQTLSERFKSINKWMIGRGVLKNPFLPAEIKGIKVPDISKRVNMLKEFHSLLLEEYEKIYSGSSHLLGKMKSIWLYLSDMLPEGDKFLKKINKTRTISDYIKAVKAV